MLLLNAAGWRHGGDTAIFRIATAGLALAFLMAVPAMAQDFREGAAHAERGDYAAALEHWRPLAKQGDAAAQYNVGLLYDSGRGVPQDYAQALKWFRKAAEQGNPSAQYQLAMMYGNGRGTRQNFLLAHKWLNVAAAKGHEDARSARDKVAKLMTAAQITAAQRLARKWWAAHMKSRAGSPRAAPPAKKPRPAEKVAPHRRGPAGV